MKPFEVGTEFVQHEGAQVSVLDRKTLRILARQPGLIVILSNAIWSANELGEDSKKS